MANPKRKWSKARTGKKRSPGSCQHKFVECPRCHSLKLLIEFVKSVALYGVRKVERKAIEF